MSFASAGGHHYPATIATDNRAGLALHTRHGFEVVGTTKNADRWMDTTLVQRSLE